MNSRLEIFSRPEAVETSRQYLVTSFEARTNFVQITGSTLKAPGLLFLKGPFLGVNSEGLMYGWKIAFQNRWASLIVGRKFNVIALLYFVFEGNFPSTSPRRAYIWKDDLTEGFLRYRFGGLIFGGAYFRNFTVVI